MGQFEDGDCFAVGRRSLHQRLNKLSSVYGIIVYRNIFCCISKKIKITALYITKVIRSAVIFMV